MPEKNESQSDQAGSSAQSGLSSIQEAGRYLHLGIEFLGAIVFFVGVGFLIDRWLGLLPLFTLIGVVIAFTAIIIQVVRFSKKETMEAERRRREASSEDSDT